MNYDNSFLESMFDEEHQIICQLLLYLDSTSQLIPSSAD